MARRNKLSADARREKISFYATAELKQTLVRLAATEEISISLLITSLLQEAMDENENS